MPIVTFAARSRVVPPVNWKLLLTARAEGEVVVPDALPRIVLVAIVAIRARAKLPVVIFDAFVVSDVAEAANVVHVIDDEEPPADVSTEPEAPAPVGRLKFHPVVVPKF